MSCKAMGVTATPIIFGGAIAITLYGCGPNLLVGLPVSLYQAAAGTCAKIQRAWISSELSNSGSESSRALAIRAQACDKAAERRFHNAKLAAISAIPLLGPWLYLFKG